VLAVDNEFTSLIGHRRPRCYSAGVSLWCKRDGVGVAEICKAAGLTHGALYPLFGSKHGLTAEAIKDGMAASNARMLKRGMWRVDPPAAYLDYYLSATHRDDVRGGCSIAALGLRCWTSGRDRRRQFWRWLGAWRGRDRGMASACGSGGTPCTGCHCCGRAIRRLARARYGEANVEFVAVISWLALLYGRQGCHAGAESVGRDAIEGTVLDPPGHSERRVFAVHTHRSCFADIQRQVATFATMARGWCGFQVLPQSPVTFRAFCSTMVCRRTWLSVGHGRRQAPEAYPFCRR
jgi:AcrR family transcriptional regulator